MRARIALAAPLLLVLSACRMAGPDMRLADLTGGSAGLRSAQYEFSLVVHGATVQDNGLVAPIVQTVRGALSAQANELVISADGNSLLSSAGKSVSCRHDVAQQVRQSSSSLRVQCANMRFVLHQRAGEIVASSFSMYVPQITGEKRGLCAEYLMDELNGQQILCKRHEKVPSVSTAWLPEKPLGLTRQTGTMP